MRTAYPKAANAAYPYRAVRVAVWCYRGQPTTPQSDAFLRFGRRCKWSSFGSLSPTKYTYAGKHNNENLAYLCGILLGGFFLLALLGPPRFGGFAGRLGPLFGRHLRSADFSPLLPQASLAPRLLDFSLRPCSDSSLGGQARQDEKLGHVNIDTGQTK